MKNILQIDDYINLYNKKSNRLLVIKPYKKTLKNGIIIDREKFIKEFVNIKEKYSLTENIFEESIFVIINDLYNKEDKKIIKSILEEVNYKNVKFINELEYLKINKDILYINYNYSYFYLLYTDAIGNTKIKIYENDKINKKLVVQIINLMDKKKVFIYGKNFKELVNILKTSNIDYYYFENSDNIIINLLLNEKKV